MPPEPSLQGFGEKLRKQREQRGITLEAISSTTKISTRMLRALEEERFEQLPGGVFNKGFVRAYARQVGLNEEESIADYLAALSESQIKSQAVAPDLRGGKAPRTLPQSFHLIPLPHEPALEVNSADAPPDDSPLTADRRHGHDRRDNEEDRRMETRRSEDRSGEDQGTEARNKDRILEDLVAGDRARSVEDSDAQQREPWQIENRPAADLLRAAHREENQNSVRQPREPSFTTGSFGKPDSASSSTRIPWATLTAVLLVVCIGLAFLNIRRHRHPIEAKSPIASPELAPTQTSRSAPALTNPTVSSANRSNKLEKISTGSKALATSSTPAAAAVSASTAKTFPSGANGSAPTGSPMTPPASLSAAKTPAAFTLLIRANETSWVSITADGRLIAEETLIAPAEKSIRASNQIVVKAGNAAGVSFLFNSKEIPAGGNEGEVRTYTFDASGMKASPASPTAGPSAH